VRKPGCKKIYYLGEREKGRAQPTGGGHRKRAYRENGQKKTSAGKRRGQKTLLECSHGVGDHESDFADHGVVELADVQAGLLLELVDAVD